MKAEKFKKEAGKSKNRSVVSILMDYLLFLAKQGLAFRGDDESCNSSNKGNVLELLDF